MDVSHFELVWKPQSPAAPTSTANVARLIQGYFLEITNLENRPLSYRVSFVASPVADPLRSLAGNTVVFVDTPGNDNQSGVLNGVMGDTTFTPSTGLIRIPALGTALIAVLPSAFGPTLDPTPLTAPNFEVRGHVRITLPPTFSVVGNLFLYGPQSQTPVRVMLTPQNRTTYFAADGTITDQTQASLPLATGAAVNALAPEQGLILPRAFDLDPQVAAVMDNIPTPSPALVGAMLAMIDPKGDLAVFNAALAKAGVGLSLQRHAARRQGTGAAASSREPA